MAVSLNARDEELFVTCKTCGFAVATGLRMRSADLQAGGLEPGAHRCPRCGKGHVYAPADYGHRSG